MAVIKVSMAVRKNVNVFVLHLTIDVKCSIITIEREVMTMQLTLDDLTLMIKEMKKNNVTQLNLDISMNDWDDVESIDFDMWADKKFIKTVLTKTC